MHLGIDVENDSKYCESKVSMTFYLATWQCWLSQEILDRHEPFSKKVVYQRMDGLTYTELIELFSKPLNECKRVYGHDLYHMRKEMERYREDWQEIS